MGDDGEARAALAQNRTVVVVPYSLFIADESVLSLLVHSFVDAASSSNWPSDIALVVAEHVSDSNFNRGACCTAAINAAVGAKVVVVHDANLMPTEWTRYTSTFNNVVRDLKTQPYFHFARYATKHILGGAVAFRRSTLLQCGGYSDGDNDADLLRRLRKNYGVDIQIQRTGPMHPEQFTFQDVLAQYKVASDPPTMRQRAKLMQISPLTREQPTWLDARRGWSQVYGLQCFDDKVYSYT